jgi:hypothetical protein
MSMTSIQRKFGLFTHIAFSVGWIGAVAPYLALAITGMVSRDEQLVRGAYLSMEKIGWFVLVPLSLAALLSGLVQALGTRWGLIRHWWVVVKFVLTIAATAVLWKHMQVVGSVARLAREASAFGPEFAALQTQLLIHPGGGLLVLLGIMAISVFKPWGLTPYRARRASPAEPVREVGEDAGEAVRPVVAMGGVRWGRVVAWHAVVLFVAAVILHVTGMHHH